MKYFILILFTFFLFNSCENEQVIHSNLIKESAKFFKKRNIDSKNFNTQFYIKKGDYYTHYVLKYYKVINNDSLIIYFTRDDTADYFMESNNNFSNYYLHH